MKTFFAISGRVPMVKAARIVSLFFVMSTLFIPAKAGHIVDVEMTSAGQHDTIWIGRPTTFDFLIENDSFLTGVSLAFKIWSPDGTAWEWKSLDSGYGFSRMVTVVPGSRMYPPGYVWDFGGLIVNERNMDEISPDTILFGGLSINHGLAAGPLEHMVSFNFVPGDSTQSTGTICIDSVTIPPYGSLIFADRMARSIIPQVGWPPGGLCGPVGTVAHEPPEIVGKPDSLWGGYCDRRYYVFAAEDRDGDPFWFEQISGPGQMDSTGYWIYQPSINDTGHALLQMRVCDIDGCSNIDTVCVRTDNYPPEFRDICHSRRDGLAGSKTVFFIDATGPEYQDELTYGKIVGPGFVDPVTGVYMWDAGPADTGLWDVGVSVSDGQSIASCTLTIHIQPDTSAFLCGDANSDSVINIGDAVYIVNYIFKNGPEPDPLAAGDANYDTAVNIGDAVYIVNYIFKNGPVLCCERPCCDKPLCEQSTPITITYSKKKPTAVDCGGNFGVHERNEWAPKWDVCCSEGSQWYVRVSSLSAEHGMDTCNQERTVINSKDDVAIDKCKEAIKDFTPQPGRVMPERAKYVSSTCSQRHEDEHKKDWEKFLNNRWKVAQGIIEALTIACDSKCPDAASAKAQLKAKVDDEFKKAYDAAFKDFDDSSPEGRAMDAENDCYIDLVNDLKTKCP